jgi:hypothetical protein
LPLQPDRSRRAAHASAPPDPDRSSSTPLSTATPFDFFPIPIDSVTPPTTSSRFSHPSTSPSLNPTQISDANPDEFSPTPRPTFRPIVTVDLNPSPLTHGLPSIDHQQRRFILTHLHHWEVHRPPLNRALPSAANGDADKPPHAPLEPLPDLLSSVDEARRFEVRNELPCSKSMDQLHFYSI